MKTENGIPEESNIFELLFEQDDPKSTVLACVLKQACSMTRAPAGAAADTSHIWQVEMMDSLPTELETVRMPGSSGGGVRGRMAAQSCSPGFRPATHPASPGTEVQYSGLRSHTCWRDVRLQLSGATAAW